ncbi:uncharacterized protein LOC141685948 [Apium graveolens]|uniref:uncharacterized protein LOC141685948 n=1 Tax=Apium graveolens TaxID=4045 RepID=UPI003D795F78
MVRVDRHGSSVENKEVNVDCIPFYSIDGSKMVVSFDEPVLTTQEDVLNPVELRKATVKDHYSGYEPSRKKLRAAKKHAIEDIYGIWDGSYGDLPYLMETLQCFNIGTKVDWLFKEDEIGEQCIPVIQIDGTHLYGPYPGVLLSATGVDGFSHIVPLAFAIVEAENLASWDWIMERLRKFVVLNQHGICIISDMHAGILAAMQKPGWCEPQNHHRFCIRHFAANFASKHKKSGMKDRIIKLASQVQPKKFELLWNQLMIMEPKAAVWFEDKPVMKWSLAYDEQKRFGIMTTNHAENWNKATLDARRLHIFTLVKALFHKVVTYFDQRQVKIASQAAKGEMFTKYAKKMLNRAITRASGHHVTIFDCDTLLFEVVTKKVGHKGGNNHIV